MSTRVQRRFTFAYGHRVAGHESKCRSLHGHNAVVYVTAVPDKGLDDIGRVVDFSVLKTKVGAWIDANWDHAMILWQDDVAAKDAMAAFDKTEQAMTEQRGWCSKVYWLPSNPTAENMAAYLLSKCKELMAGTGARVTRIRIEETENCSAVVG